MKAEITKYEDTNQNYFIFKVPTDHPFWFNSAPTHSTRLQSIQLGPKVLKGSLSAGRLRRTKKRGKRASKQKLVPVGSPGLNFYRVTFLTGPTQKSSKYGTGPTQKRNIATGETSQAITSFDYFHFFRLFSLLSTIFTSFDYFHIF